MRWLLKSKVEFFDTGKTDTTYQTLMMWPDKANPELCPILHLMVYLFAIGWTGGHLFPSHVELTEPPITGNYVTWLPYATFLSRFQTVCKKLITRDGPFGTHTCRKTGYLLAVWASADFKEIMKSARHLDILSAQRYAQDAAALLHLAQINGQTGTVSPWQSIYIQNIQIARSLNQQGSRNSQPIHVLAQYFLVNLCGVDVNCVNYSIHYIMEQVWDFQGTKSVKEKISDWIGENAEGANPNDLWNLVEDYSASLYNSQVAAYSTSITSQVLRAPLAMVENSEGANNNPEERDEALFDFDYDGIKHADGTEKLELILAAKTTEPAVYGQMSKKAKQFLSKTLKPVSGCLVEHFGGDRERFLRVYGEAYSAFSTKCKGITAKPCDKSRS